MISRWIFRVIVFTLLLFPLLLLLTQVGDLQWPTFAVWSPIALRAVLQSLISAIGAVLIGILGGIGLIAWPGRQKVLTSLLVLPSFLPSLAICSSLLNLVHPFPFGWVGIVVAHIILNAGLVATQIASFLQSRSFQAFCDHALCDGANRMTFWFRAGLRELTIPCRQSFLFVFALCLSSFTIPLVLGGGAPFTFEVSIYEHFRFDPNANLAIGFAVIQMIIFAVFAAPSLVQIRQRSGQSGSEFKSLSLISFGAPIAIFPALALSLLGLSGLPLGFQTAWQQWTELSGLHHPLLLQCLGTLLIGALAGMTTLILSVAIGFFSPDSMRDRTLNTLHGAGFAVSGFALSSVLKLNYYFSPLRLLIVAMAVTILVFPAVFRLRLYSLFDSLQEQLFQAETLGASRTFTAHTILWPQMKRPALEVSGLVAFWASGDFAISTFLLPSDATLPLSIRGLMGSYHFELANLYVLLNLACGVLLWLLFQGFRDVERL